MGSIDLYLGNDLEIDYTINDEDGSAVDLTAGGNALITFSVKEKPSDTSYVFQRQNTEAGGGDTEVVEVAYASGTFTVILVPANTEDLDWGSYYYDVEIETGSGTVYTADAGGITLKRTITEP